jgi:bile acid:Na+ symporter, BASS family
MTLQDAIVFGLKASVMLVVFALGLKTRVQDVTYFVRHPGLLARSLFAMDLVMPAFAIFAIAAVTTLPGPVKIAIAALSVSPVPPMMPGKAGKTGGTQEYAIGLLVAASVVALAFVPLAVGLLGVIFGVDMHVSFLTIATLMTTMILGPLTVGIIVRNSWPALAERVARPLRLAATVLLVIGLVLILFKMWPQMMSLVGNGTLLVLAAFVLVGLAAGHFLGGPDPDDRSVLAIATSSRHPGVAIAIASASFPEQKLASAAIVLYLLVSALVAFPYVSWRKRRAAAQNGAPGRT